MLSCPSRCHFHSPPPCLLRPNPIFTIFACVHSDHHIQDHTLRRQNSKSTAALLRHLSQSHPQDPVSMPQHHDHSVSAEEEQEDEEKLKLLQLSLASKRTPQFPGSIYVQSPGDPDVNTSLPPLQTLFQGKAQSEADSEDEKIILRALEIRRKVTVEIFKEAMRNGKFGITYATNLTNRLGPFIDYVMIEAAAMKRLPEFSETTFNFRAKTVIQDSNVVPVIRYKSEENQ